MRSFAFYNLVLRELYDRIMCMRHDSRVKIKIIKSARAEGGVATAPSHPHAPLSLKPPPTLAIVNFQHARRPRARGG